MRSRNQLLLLHRSKYGCEPFGQAFALVDIEDGEALEECHLPGLAILVAGAFLLMLWREAIGIADDRAALALADMAAGGVGLGIGQPALRCVTTLDDGRPQHQDVDAGIAPAGRGIDRHGAGAGGGIPGLDPGKPSRLELGDDAVGDLGIEALTDIGHGSAPSKHRTRGRNGGGAAGADRQSPPIEAGCTQRAATDVEEPGASLACGTPRRD